MVPLYFTFLEVISGREGTKEDPGSRRLRGRCDGRGLRCRSLGQKLEVQVICLRHTSTSCRAEKNSSLAPPGSVPPPKKKQHETNKHQNEWFLLILLVLVRSSSLSSRSAPTQLGRPLGSGRRNRCTWGVLRPGCSLSFGPHEELEIYTSRHVWDCHVGLIN